MSDHTPHETDTTRAIRDQYGQTARSGLSSDDAGVNAVAQAFGYSADELASIPAAANMGLSCGNPIALANLKPGEVVVDLGSGGGLDVFLAADKVGPTGQAIGIDMTPDMIALARRNAERGPGGKPYTNVRFELGSIGRLSLADNSVDVMISNCVINLADDKPAVFAEMLRVLKPGGRVAVSDIALKQALPAELAGSIAALVGCIAGAIPIDEFEQGLIEAGFEHVTVVDAQSDLNAYAQVEGQAGCCTPPAPETGVAAADEQAVKSPASCCGTGPAATELPIVSSCCEPAVSSPLHDDLAALSDKYDLNAYAASVKVFAIKAG